MTLNKYLEHYLRVFCSLKPKTWYRWLPLAEYWYNTNIHSSTKITPFEAVYVIPPPRLLSYVKGTTKVDVVDQELRS